MYNGEVNPFEKINTQVIYCTSAGTKSSYAYGVLIDTFENTILNPKANFCIVRVPVRTLGRGPGRWQGMEGCP